MGKPKRAAQERRTQTRFEARSGIFTLDHHLGKIIDISVGGLSFEYAEQSESGEPPAGLGTIFDDEELCLDRIPVSTINDIVSPEAAESSESTTVLRRCSVRFHDLSPMQRCQLENFIWFNTETAR